MPLILPLPTASPDSDIGQYIQYLLTAIDEYLQAPDIWADGDYDDAYGYMEDLKAWIAANIGSGGSSVYPASGLHWHYFSTVLNGNAIGYQIISSMLYNQNFYQNTSANNDEFEFTMDLQAGDYVLDFVYAKGTAGGQCRLTMPDTSYIDLDMYQNTNNYNVAGSQSFTVSDGTHTFNGLCTGKNGSSSGYNLRFLYFHARKV